MCRKAAEPASPSPPPSSQVPPSLPICAEHHNQRRRPNEPLLSVVQGLYVRYKARGYHLGAVSRFVMDGGRALLSVQAPQAGDDAPPTLLIPAESVSSLNCLAREADWEAHGAEELRELAAYLQAAGRTLLLRQVRAGVRVGVCCRRTRCTS